MSKNFSANDGLAGTGSTLQKIRKLKGQTLGIFVCIKDGSGSRQRVYPQVKSEIGPSSSPHPGEKQGRNGMVAQSNLPRAVVYLQRQHVLLGLEGAYPERA